MTLKPFFFVLAWSAFTASASANPITISQTDNNIAIIPPDNLSGMAETISLGSSIQSITDVELTLNIGGTANNQPFNGNYYAYLSHGSTLVVLLNRVGVTASNPYGYADEGFDVTFSDSGSDIHNYQNGSYTLNGSDQLTGTWAPDGRTASPLSVLDTSPRGPLLSAFDGQNSGGGWTQFIADAATGDLGDLDGWSLQVTGTTGAVPDSGGTLELLVIAVSPLALWSLCKPHRLLARSCCQNG
jgi:hypothetical protein